MKEITDYLISEKCFVSILILLAAILICFFVKRGLRRFTDKVTDSHKLKNSTRVACSVIRGIVLGLAVLFVLQVNNINVGALVTGLGIAGIVVAFAVQDLLKDLIMGLGILIGDFFKVGDIVTYGDIEEGRIIAFTMKTTKIYDVNTANVLSVSNRNISEIKKLSGRQDIMVPAPYPVPAPKMRAVCDIIAERIKTLPLVTDCRFLGTDEFADSKINYCIRIFGDPAKIRETKWAANGIIQDVFAEQGIEVPFNQLDVHIKNQ